MSATRFLFTLDDGSIVVGVVQGSGGVIGANDCRRMKRIVELAHEGRDTGIYEPQPGHARVFVTYDRDGGGEHVDLDLRRVRGVSIVGVTP